MSELFIPSKKLTMEENVHVKEKLINANHSSGEGHVFTIHETQDGRKEILEDDHNHIVYVGRRWLMQRAFNQNFSTNIKEKDWYLTLFSIGSGGAPSGDPFTPENTPDTTYGLSNILHIEGTEQEDSGIYLNNHEKKVIDEISSGKRVEFVYDEGTGKILSLAHCVVDFKDCNPSVTTSINELGLYSAPNIETNNTQWRLFSRYTRPTISKTKYDRYIFLWYIYF